MMAANKIVRFGPIALTVTLTTNIFNPPTLTGGVGVPGTTVNCYYLIKHLRIVNKTATFASFSLWIGATGGNVAGTEFMGIGNSVGANNYVEAFFPNLRLDVADFLVGGSGTTLSLTL